MRNALIIGYATEAWQAVQRAAWRQFGGKLGCAFWGKIMLGNIPENRQKLASKVPDFGTIGGF